MKSHGGTRLHSRGGVPSFFLPLNTVYPAPHLPTFFQKKKQPLSPSVV
jgi:hypothetical protein